MVTVYGRWHKGNSPLKQYWAADYSRPRIVQTWFMMFQKATRQLRLMKDCTNHHIGVFDTREEAVAARNQKAKELYLIDLVITN